MIDTDESGTIEASESLGRNKRWGMFSHLMEMLKHWRGADDVSNVDIFGLFWHFSLWHSMAGSSIESIAPGSSSSCWCAGGHWTTTPGSLMTLVDLATTTLSLYLMYTTTASELVDHVFLLVHQPMYKPPLLRLADRDQPRFIGPLSRWAHDSKTAPRSSQHEGRGARGRLRRSSRDLPGTSNLGFDEISS